MANTYPVAIKFSAVDQLTAPMRSINSAVSKTLGSMQAAANRMSVTLGALAKRASIAALGLGVGTGYLVKGWLEASMQMEGYFAKLKTALKSPEAARAMMEWAKKFAAETPFEMSSVVDAVARLEMYGLSAKKWLPMVGDMAGAMGRDVSDAVEAIADALSGGGLERMKEFGISSKVLKDAGWLGGYQTAEELDSLRAALEAILQSRFGGGMTEMMQTAAGAVSNFQDALFRVKTALGDALMPVLKRVIEIAIPLFDALSAKVREVAPQVSDYLLAKLNGLYAWFQEKTPEMQQRWGEFVDWVKTKWTELKEKLSDPETKQNLNEFWNSIQSLVNTLGQLTFSTLDATMDAIIDNAPLIAGSLQSIADMITDHVIPAIDSLEEKWKNSGALRKGVEWLMKDYQTRMAIGEFYLDAAGKDKTVGQAWSEYSSKMRGIAGSPVMSGAPGAFGSSYSGGGYNYGSAGNGAVTVRLDRTLEAARVDGRIRVQKDRDQGEMRF